MRLLSVVPLVGAVTVVGCIVGAIVGLAQTREYRATTTLLVESHGAPATLPTVAALAVSETVIRNVADAMHVDADLIRSHLRARLQPGTALVRLDYDDTDRSRATQIAQQEATVLEAIVGARLGSSARASIADPASATALGRPVGRDLLLGGAVGFGLGLAAAASLRRRSAVPRVPSPATEPQLGDPAATEAREPAPRPVPAAPAVPPPAPAVPPPAPAVPPPAPAVAPPAPAVPPPAAAVPPPASPGRVAELRALVAEHGADFSPDQRAEWHGYLDALAAQEVDGELPQNLAGLVQDVFAPLLERP